MTDSMIECPVLPDKVRISATYRQPCAGDTVPAGRPETVELIYNDDLPGEPGERTAFLTALIDALFRDEPQHVRMDFAAGPSDRFARDMRANEYARGGRLR